MKRRSFLQSSSAISLPVLLGGMPLMAVGRNALSSLINPDDDRILVLINLNGGNDGLSTLVPLDKYDNLQSLRPNLLVPENSVLELIKDNGFHPAMGGMKEVWDAGKLNIIQSVGYPNQNRSHFRSTDIWQTGSGADEYLDTGWMGRFFQKDHPTYPDNYPNQEFSDPFAITIGGVISETCQGDASTFSLALIDPENPGTVVAGLEDELPDNCYGRELDFIRKTANFANVYAETIIQANQKGSNKSNKYSNTSISNGLKSVARLISGGLCTRVYVLQMGGFDLHSGLVDEGNPQTGQQTKLLTELSDAICAFQEDLDLMGLDKKVVGMTFSEFGRQIKQNESNGSDHGTAAPLFIFGSCVNPDIIGENPEIDRQVEDQAGVPMQYDFRSVYGSLLHQWFKVPEDEVRSILFDDFQMLPIIEGCVQVNSEDQYGQEAVISAFPNPCVDYLTVKVLANGETTQLSLFDTRGAQVRRVGGHPLSSGEHQFTVDMNGLSSGTYHLRYAVGGLTKTVKIVKH